MILLNSPQKPPFNVNEHSHNNPKPSPPTSQRVLFGHITTQAAVLQDEEQGTCHVMTAGEEWEWDTGAHDSDTQETHDLSIYSDIGEEEDEDVTIGANGGRNRRTLSQDYLSRLAPSIIDARAAKEDIKSILFPRRATGYGHKDPKLDHLVKRRFELMRTFLGIYVDPIHGKDWMEASLDAVRICDKGRQNRTTGTWAARDLHQRTKSFIQDQEDIPHNPYHGSISRIEDEAFRQDLLVYLQGIGKYVCAMDIVTFTNQQDMKEKYNLKKGISIATAQRWMSRIGYRWGKTPTGQYVDGHEREDVVKYRQQTFIPTLAEFRARTRSWDEANLTVEEAAPDPGRKVVIWHHDESVFYANDRRKKRWVHTSENAVPYAKGEGASLMVADFVSADYGPFMDGSPRRTETKALAFISSQGRTGMGILTVMISSVKRRRQWTS